MDNLDKSYEENRGDKQQKIRFDLLVPEFIEEMARRMTEGAKKYKSEAWKNEGEFSTTCFTSAIGRHYFQFMKGCTENDTLNEHLVAIAINAMFVFYRKNMEMF